MNSYGLTQPFGFWSPVKARFKPTFVSEVRKDTYWDILTLCAALPWQYLLYLIWMAIIMQTWITFGVSTGIVAILTIVLYFTWLRRLNWQSVHKREVECIVEEDKSIVLGDIVELQEVHHDDQHSDGKDDSIDELRQDHNDIKDEIKTDHTKDA
jgi:hypothetical protein